MYFLPVMWEKPRKENSRVLGRGTLPSKHYQFWASPDLSCRVCPQGDLEAEGLAQVHQCCHIMLCPKPILNHSQ